MNTKNQEIKYYLTEGMTEIIPVIIPKPNTVSLLQDWVTDNLQQSKHRAIVTPELREKFDKSVYYDGDEVDKYFFRIAYQLIEGEITLVATV